MLRPKDILFGEIAIALRLMTPERVAECIDLQRRSHPNKRLGAICQSMGYLTSTEVERVLRNQVALQVSGRTASSRDGTP